MWSLRFEFFILRDGKPTTTKINNAHFKITLIIFSMRLYDLNKAVRTNNHLWLTQFSKLWWIAYRINFFPIWLVEYINVQYGLKTIMISSFHQNSLTMMSLSKKKILKKHQLHVSHKKNCKCLAPPVASKKISSDNFKTSIFFLDQTYGFQINSRSRGWSNLVFW